MSWKCEVKCDSVWTANGLRFATEAEAVEYGRELLSRWMVPEDSRAIATDEPVNYVWVDGKATPIGGGA